MTPDNALRIAQAGAAFLILQSRELTKVYRENWEKHWDHSEP